MNSQFRYIKEQFNNTLNNSTEILFPEDKVWGAAIGVGIGLLILSFILTFFIILCFRNKENKKKLNILITILISIAIGSLFGDCIIHILPDLYGESIDEGSNPQGKKIDSNLISLIICLGFITFFIIEKILSMFGGGHNHSHTDEDDKIENCNDQHTTKTDFSELKKKPVGCMTIISSFIHNTLDGLSIGVTFANRKSSVILSTCIAILLHEIPKEIGDAGILINSNYKVWQVLFWNVINNITNIVGVIIGVALGEIDHTSTKYALAFIAGNFLYISLVDMVPEILKKKGWVNLLVQIFFIIFGIGMMYSVLLVEHD